MLPAFMITTIHPNYFVSRNDQRCEGEPIPKDEIVFIRLRDTCKKPGDVLLMLEKIFDDIKDGKRQRDFQVAEEQKRGRGGALANALILEPNFAGVGVDLKRLWSALRGSSEQKKCTCVLEMV